jgi:hypothetical protein
MAAPTVDLENAVWLRRMEIPVVVTLPDLPFLEVGTPGGQHAVPDDPRGPALGVDDLPPPAPRDMAPPTESQALAGHFELPPDGGFDVQQLDVQRVDRAVQNRAQRASWTE